MVNTMTYTGTDYDLEYLFVAELRNGQLIRQDPTDRAKNSSWGSAFTDVIKEHLESIRRFSLVGKGHIYTIDLDDGHLEVDGHKLYPPKEILPGAKLQLIYWRQVTKDIKVDQNGKPIPPRIKYIIGWQYNLKGHNYKWGIGD